MTLLSLNTAIMLLAFAGIAVVLALVTPPAKGPRTLLLVSGALAVAALVIDLVVSLR